jgi:hypothetical protein
VLTVEAAWNASDMNAMWQLATDDIYWVNVVGMHWQRQKFGRFIPSIERA